VYENTVWLNVGNQGGQREVQAGDDLILLSCHILVDLAVRGIDTPAPGKGAVALPSPVSFSYLVQAAALLQRGIKASPFNFQFVILAIEVFGALGAYLPIPSLFGSLGVKSIQNDSLSYIALADANHCAHFTESSGIHEKVCGYARTSRREVLGL